MPLLLILYASLPVTVVAPSPPLPPRERVRFAVTPTAAARALSMEGVEPPARPVTFAFRCSVLADSYLYACRDEGEAGSPADAPLRRAALARTRYYRVDLRTRPRAMPEGVPVRITVSAADLPTPARGGVDKGELIVSATGVDIRQFYPPPAQRAGVGARVTATCRVMTDLSLYCRDAETDGAPGTGRAAEIDEAFRRATRHAFSQMRAAPTLRSGGDSVGREARLSIVWAMS